MSPPGHGNGGHPRPGPAITELTNTELDPHAEASHLHLTGNSAGLARAIARTAHHEAGHAVAYLVHGRRFRYVTVRPRAAGLSGRVVVHPKPIDHWTRAIIAHAGPLAEGRHEVETRMAEFEAEGYTREDVIAGAYLAGGHGDVEAIQQSVHALGLAADPFEDVATRIVDANWQAVIDVAQALIKHHTLTYADVVDLTGRWSA